MLGIKSVKQVLTAIADLITRTKGLNDIHDEVDTLEATLGAVDTAAATGVVSDVKKAMAYIKELITGLALDGSAPHSYDYTKATVPGWLHGFHMIRRILFVVPEALAGGLPNTVHNVAIKAQLDMMGLVITITQADALTYPDYESITLTVLGSPLDGAAWTTSNLAHIKSIFGLPVVCVDATAAAYLKMGTDGGDAATKTVLNAIANIEGSILGAGIDDTVGLAAGANTVADAGVTFSTLDMSGGEITEIWYGWETTEDETDVLLAEIRKTMPDATPGKDIDGADVPGTLAFYGCAYSMDGLNTLGKAVLHLLVEKLLHSSTAGLAVILSGEVGNLAATIGVRATPAAAGPVTNTDKLMAYIKQLVTELQVLDGIVDDILVNTRATIPVITTIATLASQTSFTLTAGSADNDAYNGMIAVIEDASTATQKAIGVISDYVGASKTITLREDPGIFTMAAGDKIAIIAVSPDILNILADTNELQTDWKNGGRLDAILDLCALEATLTAIKGADFATGTDSLKILSDVLDTITAAGPTKAEMDTAHALLATVAKQNRVLCSMDFWSDVQEEVAVTSTAGPQGLPSVVIADLPADAVIVRAIAMFKFRMVENTHETEVNAINVDQYIQVKKATKSYVNAIKMVNTSFALAAATREGGDVIIGNLDLVGVDQVDANATYECQWTDADALQNNLQFNDVQMGLRIWYSV